MLELGAEEAPVGVDGLVEIGDRHAEVVDIPSGHERDASRYAGASADPADKIAL